MTFSIVIPTYNGERYIEQAIRSVLAQTRAADEIIVSDDNSKDRTLKICAKYSDRIKIYKNQNGPSGFVNGWNNAIAHATSDFVSILHQDDLLAPTFLEEIEKAALANPDVRHFFVPCKYIDSMGQVLREPDYCTSEVVRYTGSQYADTYSFVGTPHIHRCPGVVTAKSIFDVCKYRAEAGHIADDDFFWRVGNHTDVIGILKPLSCYREHSSSETGHLDNSVLIRRLLDDHCFQCQNFKDNPILSKKLKSHLRKWKRKYAVRSFIISAKRLDGKNALHSIISLFS